MKVVNDNTKQPGKVDLTNPCIAICKFNNEHGFCFGCYRTADERRKWHSMTDGEKCSTLATVFIRRIKYPSLEIEEISGYYGETYWG